MIFNKFIGPTVLLGKSKYPIAASSLSEDHFNSRAVPSETVERLGLSLAKYSEQLKKTNFLELYAYATNCEGSIYQSAKETDLRFVLRDPLMVMVCKFLKADLIPIKTKPSWST